MTKQPLDPADEVQLMDVIQDRAEQHETDVLPCDPIEELLADRGDELIEASEAEFDAIVAAELEALDTATADLEDL